MLEGIIDRISSAEGSTPEELRISYSWHALPRDCYSRHILLEVPSRKFSMLRLFLILQIFVSTVPVVVSASRGSTWHGDVPSRSHKAPADAMPPKQRSIDIRGRVALVNGANRGIGKAILEGFLQNGASKVYAAVRSVSSVDELVERYGKDRVIPIQLDVTDQASIDQAAAIAQDVDVVVNNAGILDLTEPMGERSREFIPSMQKQMDVNVFGLVRMAQAFIPMLEKKASGGAFVQINSTSSLRCPGAHFTGYAASKAAAYSVVQGLRSSARNTAIISVHPGPIATDMVDQFGARSRSEPAEQVADAIVEALREGEILVFPDSISRKIGQAYMPFAESIVLPTTNPPSSGDK